MKNNCKNVYDYHILKTMIQETLENCIGFEWDKGNLKKNWIKHKVSQSECEQLFFNHPLIVEEDQKHSETENRYLALGITNFGRRLFISLTVRNNKIRIISARPMHPKERSLYEKRNS